MAIPLNSYNKTILAQPDLPEVEIPFNPFEGLSNSPQQAPIQPAVTPEDRRPSGRAENRPRYADSGDTRQRFDDVDPQHSGLGIASFLIALLVGGLDVIMMIMIVTSIAGKKNPTAEEVTSEIADGGIAIVCLNCMSVPVCIVGFGLAMVGLERTSG